MRSVGSPGPVPTRWTCGGEESGSAGRVESRLSREAEFGTFDEALFGAVGFVGGDAHDDGGRRVVFAGWMCR